jgi:hypothetical protein
MLGAMHGAYGLGGKFNFSEHYFILLVSSELLLHIYVLGVDSSQETILTRYIYPFKQY